jgi:hypothetical protein
MRRHSGRDGAERRALVHRPRRARVGLAELLHDLHVRRKIDFAPADRARDRNVEQAGVGDGSEDRAWKLAVSLDFVRAFTDERRNRARRIER